MGLQKNPSNISTKHKGVWTMKPLSYGMCSSASKAPLLWESPNPSNISTKA